MAWLSVKRLCLLLAAAHMLLGWRVGVWLSGPFAGLRKLRPRVELQRPFEGCKARALATEQKRNVHSAHGYDAC